MNTEALQKAQEKLRKMRESGEFPVLMTSWEKLREKPTLKRAVTAMCCDCMGWQEKERMPPGLRGDIRDCTVFRCPLYEFRPWQNFAMGTGKAKTPSASDSESIAASKEW